MRALLLHLICFFMASTNVYALPGFHKREAPFDQVRTRLNHHYQDVEEDEPNKYFHEATFHQHYDGRFGDKQLKYDERLSHLSALIQTYFSAMNDIGAETWIMHGTLLGWYWNREILPWDTDLDVMVSERTLYHLAAYYNMTMHHYHIPGLDTARNYMLEVNPHYSDAGIDSSNQIDARWIDTETGLFIDITALRRNHTAEEAGAADEANAMMVKDNHHYLYDDIFPLRHSTFADAPVRVPFAYPDILTEEYGEEALSKVFYEHHRFSLEKEEWKTLRFSELHGLSGLSRNTSYWGMRLPLKHG